MSKRRRRRRRHRPWGGVLRTGLLLAVLALVVWAGLYLLRRGKGRTDLYRAAIEALARGDRETAERHLRTLLASGTQRREAATQLMTILLESQRYDEAEQLAEQWRSEPGMARVGWRAAIELALRRLRLVEAERLAREQAELDPEYAQFTILRVRDLLGSFQGRWAAQRAAVALGTLTASDEVRTRTFLFAAETLRDLIAQATDDRLVDSLRPACQRATNEALASLIQLRDDPAVVDSAAVRELRARIALLSPQAQERAQAVETLEAVLAADPSRYEARASLAAFATNQARWDDAGAHVRRLAEGPPLLWIRAIQRLEAHGRDTDALELLRAGPREELPLVRLYEARILLRGDAAAVAAGRATLLALAREEGLHASLALEAFRLLTASGSAEGTAPLVAAVRASGDSLELAALAQAALQVGDDTLALDLVRASAGGLEDLAQGQLVLALLARGGDRLLEAYLEAPLPEDAAGARRRFLRAASAAAQAGPDPSGAETALLRRAARADLRALEALDAPKTELAQAWRVALALSDPELVGGLAARAIAKAGPPHDLAFGLLAWAADTDDAALRRRVAAGLRAAAADGVQAGFLDRLADLVVEHPEDPARIQAAFADLGAAVPARYLQAQAAWFAGDLEAGEAVARRLREEDPGSSAARDLLGAFLLRRQAWDELIALQDAVEPRSLPSFQQIVSALLAQGEPARALALARRCVRDHPEAAEAHLILAEVLSGRGEVHRALGVLSVAPPTPAVNVLRARLLLEEGEAAVAEDLLRETIAANPQDVEPWRRLYLLLTRTGERGRIIETVTEALESPQHQEGGELRADLFLMRGMARMGRNEDDLALRDFEDVVRLRPDDSVALNNAAWLLVEHRSDRLDQALDYAQRAVEADPSNADIHDTIAVIHLKRSAALSGEARHEVLIRALEAADRAVALNEEAREAAFEAAGSEEDARKARLAAARPNFRLNRAIVLDRLDRRGDAIDDLDWIVKNVPDSLAAIRAGSILNTWARESG